MFIDILKVGAVACFSPLQSVLTISIFTHMLASFGTEILAGYGIGARLEFMLTSIAFAVGIASVPMVGMAIGAARIARARRICWIAGLVAFVSVGAVASFIAIFPDIWVNLFTDDASVRAASRQYLSTAAPMYAFLGLATTCYFSSQGAAKVIGPVLAQTARLLFIGAGGWWLSTHDATAQNFFMLAAASMVLLGVLSCVSVMLTRWGPKQRPAAGGAAGAVLIAWTYRRAVTPAVTDRRRIICSHGHHHRCRGSCSSMSPPPIPPSMRHDHAAGTVPP